MEQQYSSPQMDICRDNPVLRQFHGPGLSAFKKSERQYIKVPDTKSIGCSVALDEAAKGTYVKSVYLSSTMSRGIKVDPKACEEI